MIRDEQRHPWLVRLSHWLFVLAILVMIGSGWRIYNNVPILPFSFPEWITLGGEPDASYAQHNEGGTGSAIAWHFAGMWLLAGSVLTYLAYGVLSGHFRRDFLPVRPRDVWADFVAAVTFKLEHRLGVYNAVQKLLYWGVLFAVVMMIVSGLAIWKPVQLYPLTWALGGFDFARVVHFAFMSVIVGFLVVHVTLVILVPKTLVAMVVGRASAPRHGEHT